MSHARPKIGHVLGNPDAPSRFKNKRKVRTDAAYVFSEEVHNEVMPMFGPPLVLGAVSIMNR